MYYIRIVKRNYEKKLTFEVYNLKRKKWKMFLKWIWIIVWKKVKQKKSEKEKIFYCFEKWNLVDSCSSKKINKIYYDNIIWFKKFVYWKINLSSNQFKKIFY